MAPPDNVSGVDRMLGQPKTYDAVFTDKKNNDTIKTSDFLALMVAQMKNQDFLNPMDDAQFVTQMAQFSTMQQMMELAEWSKSNYAMSLVGKTVTASRFNVSGGLDTTMGLVDRISFVDNEYVLYIGDKRYTLSQIMEVHATPTESKEADKAADSDKETKALDASGLKVEAAESTADAAVVYWKAPIDDSARASLLRYTVYISAEGPFTTLEAVKKGTSVPPMNRTDTVVTIPGLEPDTTYYVNVVVNDATGAESVYQPVKISTKAVETVVPVGLPEEEELEDEELEADEIQGEEEEIEAGEIPVEGDGLEADALTEPEEPTTQEEPTELEEPDTPTQADAMQEG
jgi:hypothetical protein